MILESNKYITLVNPTSHQPFVYAREFSYICRKFLYVHHHHQLHKVYTFRPDSLARLFIHVKPSSNDSHLLGTTTVAPPAIQQPAVSPPNKTTPPSTFSSLAASVSRPADFAAAPPPPTPSMAANLPPSTNLIMSGMSGLSGLFPPAAMAMAARQFAAQQNQPVSSAAAMSTPPGRLNSMPTNRGGATNRSPTKIPRVGQGQITCNCGNVFPSLELLEHHAKAVHPENTNLVRV